MAIDTTPSQVATSALQALPFGSIIGGPLKAAIEAQAMAAKTSWNFIQEVGLNTDPDTGEKKTINVSFQFVKDGRIAQLNVPLLTIVPIPYIPDFVNVSPKNHQRIVVRCADAVS